MKIFDSKMLFSLFLAILFLSFGCGDGDIKSYYSSEQREIVKEANKNLLQEDPNKPTPRIAQLLCILGRKDKLQKCLKKGLNKNDLTTNRNILLTAEYGHMDCCRYLYELGADINASNADGVTVLHFAARSGNCDFCDFLIAKGANLQKRTSNGKSVLHYAVQSGNMRLCKFLIEKGLDINSISFSLIKSIPQDEGKELQNYLLRELATPNYNSIKSECDFFDTQIHLAENKMSNWEHEIVFYQEKEKLNPVVLIKGFIQKRTRDGWYIFSAGDEIGAFTLEDGREYTTTGHFTEKMVPLGFSSFDTIYGGTESLPTFRNASLREQLFDSINRCMVRSAQNNISFQKSTIQKLKNLKQQKQELLSVLTTSQNKTEILSVEKMKEIVNKKGSKEIRKLAKEGFDFNMVFKDGNEEYTMLIYAIKEKRNDVVKTLLSLHASQYVCGKLPLHHDHNVDVSPLGVAIFYDNTEIAKLLIKNDTLLYNGCSPYSLAFWGHYGDNEKILLYWSLLKSNGIDARYLDQFADDQCIIEIGQFPGNAKLIDFLVNSCSVNPWYCTNSYYGIPEYAEDSLQVILSSWAANDIKW